MTDDIINWELLSYAAGGSSRGALEQSAAGDAYGLLADLECLSAEERLERLAAEIQALLEQDDPVQPTEKETRDHSCSDPRTEMRGVSPGSDRGHQGGSRSMLDVRPDSKVADLPAGLKGSLFFESVFRFSYLDFLCTINR